MKPPKPRIAVKYHTATHGEHTPVRIVLHSTESDGDIESIARYWQAQGQGLGSHFIIDGAGNIGQGCAGNQKTWTVAGHNTGSIHIEIMGYAAWSKRKWRSRRSQQRKLVNLIAYESQSWGIPLVHSTAHGVCRHMDFHGTGADHSDPGEGFPFNEVVRKARRRVRRYRFLR